MGGDYYDRDVISTSGTGAGNNVVGKTYQLNKGLNPKTYVIDQGSIKTAVSNPIVFALDVTGSMGVWPKIIYDKMPMFYGQIMMQKYLNNPAISFCAIGDLLSDNAPLQVTRFGQGKEIDELIAKMWLEGGGGGNKMESYELAAYFYNHYCDLDNPSLPFFFVTGDQGFFPKPPSNKYQEVLGEKPPGQAVNAKQQWSDLMTKFNVFHLKKRYDNQSEEPKIYQQWCDAIGAERVIIFETPKASVDIVLGLIALTSGVRTLETYIADMNDRGQDEARISEVKNALNRYAQSLGTKAIKVIGNVLLQNKQQTIGSFRAYYFKIIAKQELTQSRQLLNKLQQQFNGQVSESMLCPITQQIIEDPVIAADGHTYQRKAIQQWLQTNKKSPVQNEVLDNANILPNNAIKKLISQWKNKRLNKQ